VEARRAHALVTPGSGSPTCIILDAYG